MYYIVSAVPGAHVPMKCARAAKIEGPWEVRTISENESLGIGQSYRLKDFRGRTGPPFEITPPNPAERFSLTLHQGGIIDTASGEWWGYSMQDHNSVGRLTGLSPVTWVDGWPYFGLPGNLTRTPKTWVKPNTGFSEPVAQWPYERGVDEFTQARLRPVWQWNHYPDDSKWSLTERPGFLRLHSMPAADFWWARNSLTQRAIGPESTATAVLDASGMQPGDVAGLAALNLSYQWVGVRREASGLVVELFDQNAGKAVARTPVQGASVLYFRLHCDFDRDMAKFSYSADGGREFVAVGGEFALPFQLKTFQGVRYALFHFNSSGAPGGYADFDRFEVDEPRARGLTKPIPYGKWVRFFNLADDQALSVEGVSKFQVIDRGTGRISLRAKNGRYLSVVADGVTLGKVKKPGESETFQWVDLQRGDTLLLSLATHRYVAVEKGAVRGDHAGPAPDRKDGSCFRIEEISR
jgi:hypothetical protein